MKVKRLHEDAVIPTYAKEGDSGFDLCTVEDAIIEPGETKLIKTGLAFDIPKGYEIQVRPRSGITLKTKLRVQLGTIDAGYKGEVGIIVDNTARDFMSNEYYRLYNCSEGHGAYQIIAGDRIAQGVITAVGYTEFEEADELSESERGVSGYGSTGVGVNE